MTTITYKNTNNNGTEKVKYGNGKFFISSDFGSGFTPWREVTKTDAKDCMEFAGAPADTIAEVLA